MTTNALPRVLLLSSFLAAALPVVIQAAPAPGPFEIWGGPAVRGPGANEAHFTTHFILSSDSGKTGATGTLEFFSMGRAAATVPFEIPAGGSVRLETPAQLEGAGAFLVRAVASGPFLMSSETANTAQNGKFGVAVPSFFAHDSLSAGDTALFPGASASPAASSSRGNAGILCLHEAPCEARIEAFLPGGARAGQATLQSSRLSAAQQPLTALMPGLLGTEFLTIQVTGVKGRFFPYVVKNDNVTSDGILLPSSVDRANGSTFIFPLGCQLERDCWIGNYVDRDPGSGIRDYGAGAITYDGHTGTDYLVNGFSAMDAGIDVLAAAGGTVIGIQDGFPDRCREDCTTPPNLILIVHPDETASAYVHLKRGSILVKEGDVVSRGQKIAEVGSSGDSSDPHLHFEVLRKDPLRAVDPYANTGDPHVTLWEKPTDYQGFGRPQIARMILSKSSEEVKSWSDDVQASSRFTSQDVLNVHLYGYRAPRGGKLEIRLLDAAGELAASQTEMIPVDAAYAHFSSPIPLEGVPAGDWLVLVLLDGRPLSQRPFTVQ